MSPSLPPPASQLVYVPSPPASAQSNPTNLLQSFESYIADVFPIPYSPSSTSSSISSFSVSSQALTGGTPQSGISLDGTKQTLQQHQSPRSHQLDPRSVQIPQLQRQQHLQSLKSNFVTKWNMNIKLYRSNVTSSASSSTATTPATSTANAGPNPITLPKSTAEPSKEKVMYICTHEQHSQEGLNVTVKIFNRGSSEVGQVGQGGGNIANANGADKLSEGIKIRGEKELEIVIGRLKNLWSLRQSCKVEGKRFRIGDMTISIGTITIGNHLHNGILLMLTYHPYSIRYSMNLQPMFKDFIKSFISPFLNSISTSSSTSGSTAPLNPSANRSPQSTQSKMNEIEYGVFEGTFKVSRVGDEVDNLLDMLRREDIL